jgi:hypothetical protein
MQIQVLVWDGHNNVTGLSLLILLYSNVRLAYMYALCKVITTK